MKRYKRDFDEPEEQELDIAEFASLDEYKRIVEKHKERVEEKRSAIDNRVSIFLRFSQGFIWESAFISGVNISLTHRAYYAPTL